MKKMLLFLLPVWILFGCSAQPTLETLGDVNAIPPAEAAWEIAVDLPAELSVPVMESQEAGQLYVCQDYTLTTHIAQSGDLDRTLRQFTGFDKERLSVMQTKADGLTRYEGVWTAAGEGSEQIGRIAVIDDGSYHYVLTAMADSASAGRLAEDWQPIFRSFRIVEPGSQVNTGS